MHFETHFIIIIHNTCVHDIGNLIDKINDYLRRHGTINR